MRSALRPTLHERERPLRRAHAVHPIAALQTEYSLWTRDPEDELLPTCRALGVGFVPYSPLGRGFLTGEITSPDDLAPDDFRRTNPRFMGENFQRNLDLVAKVREIARERGLEPLADLILNDRGTIPAQAAEAYVQGEVADAKAALEGARDILMERFAEDAALLGALRDLPQDEVAALVQPTAAQLPAIRARLRDAAVAELAAAVQDATGESVALAYVDQGYTGGRAEGAAAAHGIRLEVVKLPEAKRGFVLLPRRWVVERSFAWAIRFRRLVKDYERYASTLADLHLVAFACIMLKQAAQLAAGP